MEELGVDSSFIALTMACVVISFAPKAASKSFGFLKLNRETTVSMLFRWLFLRQAFPRWILQWIVVIMTFSKIHFDFIDCRLVCNSLVRLSQSRLGLYLFLEQYTWSPVRSGFVKGDSLPFILLLDSGVPLGYELNKQNLTRLIRWVN